MALGLRSWLSLVLVALLLFFSSISTENALAEAPSPPTKSEAAKVQLQQISSALDLYRLEIGRYPTQEENLVALVEAPPGLNKWSGPYLKKKDAIVDPWGLQFLYKVPGEHGDYDLYTLGADNAQGGNGEDRDITSW